MTKQLPYDAYQQTVDMLLSYGLDVYVRPVLYRGEPTDFVIVDAPRVSPGLWCMLERWQLV